MVLPVIKSALDCADLHNTVLPYAQELYRLPQLIFENVSSPTALRQIYLDTNPLVTAFALSLFLAPIFLIVSEVNKKLFAGGPLLVSAANYLQCTFCHLCAHARP